MIGHLVISLSTIYNNFGGLQKTPPPNELSRGVKSGLGKHAASFIKPNQKLLPAPPDFKKNIVLAFLKATWLQIPYWVYFTFKI